MASAIVKIGDSSQQDRISVLPDEILLHILSLLPIKSAATTSILSRRWRTLNEYLWIQADTLDFGKDFARNQSNDQFVDNVNRYLKLHKRDKIEGFLLFLNKGIKNQVYFDGWIEFATVRSVKKLDIHFPESLYFDGLQLPSFLFSCDSLTHLKLGQCDFSPPLNFTGFKSLESLFLGEGSITNEAIESILSNCPLLTNLSLLECYIDESLKILGPQDHQLKSLLVAHCMDGASDIDVSVPNLRSFHFLGYLCSYTFQNVHALEDVYLDSTDYDSATDDYIHMLSTIRDIKILTICSEDLLGFGEAYQHMALPVVMHNLRELQIIMDRTLDEDYAVEMYGSFYNAVFPSLEKLFIELSYSKCDSSPESQHVVEINKKPEYWFSHLKTIKITNFRGSENEMKLVKFFLRGVVSLEHMVLVAAQNSDLEKQIINMKDSANFSSQSKAYDTLSCVNIHDELMVLPKRSKGVQILLCGDWEVASRSLLPTHTKYHCKPIPYHICH